MEKPKFKNDQNNQNENKIHLRTLANGKNENQLLYQH